MNRLSALLAAHPHADAPRHLPALDGARGGAALVVLVSHAANEGLVPGILGQGLGQMGVNLFFLLSGFLMAYLYADQPFDRAQIVRYARHRAGRVLPLFFAIVLLSWALANVPWLWVFPIESPGAFVRLLLILHGEDVLWTIPVEVHYYLLFVPLWLLHARGRTLTGLGLCFVAGAAMAILLRLAGTGDGYLPFWLHLFLIGSLAGLLMRRQAPAAMALAGRPAASAIGWGVLGLSVLALPGVRRLIGLPVLPHWIDPISVGIPFLIFVCALLELGPFRWLALKPLRWLGAISYGVYLIHRPVLMTLMPLAENAGTAQRLMVFAAVIAVTLTIATLSFRLFERPVQRLFAARPQRATAVAAE
jgi:peptidoglycan/LPS O-acetylase OafA/YrhL